MTSPSFNFSRLVDAVIVILIVSAVAGGSHFWITDRLGVLRAVFPLQGKVTQWSTQCSPGAPEWMSEAILHAVDNFSSPANQLAYVSPDGAVHHCENGWTSELYRSPPVDPSVRFRVASITKVFTADAILGLIADGKITLNTRFTDLFHELPTPADARIKEISILDLLTHTAGFDRLLSVDPMFAHEQKPWCPYNLEELSRIQLDFAPGERQAYSNRGYCLLGQVIERVTGEPFRHYMETQYGLAFHGFEFVDGPYLSDEVRYDFRNHDFYMVDYWKLFDFEALSPVAGLSGNALGLAHSVKSMLTRERFNLLSARLPDGCDKRKLQGCYGYAFYHYQPATLEVYVHEGYLPGTMPILMVDSLGGVLTLLPSGKPLENRKRVAMIGFMYESLSNYYEYWQGHD